MSAVYTYEGLKELFGRNMTRDALRSCARKLSINPVGFKKIDLEDIIVDHVLRWGLKVPDEYMKMHRKTRGRPKKTKIHIQTQTEN